MKRTHFKPLCLLTAAALMLSLASCSGAQSSGAAETQTAAAQSESSDAASSATQSTANGERPEGAPEGQFDGTAGKITSIEGTTVTVALGTLSGGPGGMPPQAGESSDAQTPPALPEGAEQGDGQNPPAPPADAPNFDGKNPPERPEGDGKTPGAPPSDGGQAGFPGFTESGESVSLDLSLITKDGSAVTAEDLSEGDLLLLTLDESGNPTAAKVFGGAPQMGQAPAAGGASAEQSGEAQSGAEQSGEEQSGAEQSGEVANA